MLLLLGLVVVVVAASTTFGFVPGFGSASVSSLFLEWYTPACLVDANGDGVLDVAGLSAGPGSDTWKLRMVDGATGSVLWSEK